VILILRRIGDKHVERIRHSVSESVVVRDNPSAATPDELAEAEIIAGFPDLFAAGVIERAPRLRWLHSFSAGVETAPFDLLRDRGIVFTNASGIHGQQMSEQIFGMMISFSRGLHISLQNQWQMRWSAEHRVDELYGKTLLIVGAGHIGQETARKAKAFDMRVIGIKRHPAPMEYFDQVRGPSDLHASLSEADYVVALVPLTPETYHLFGEVEFAAMKPTAVFLNFARGDVVDEDALVNALQSGLIAGAGLDVFHQEPLPPDHPLWRLQNVLITPHNAGLSPQYNARAVDQFLRNYRAFREGRPMESVVDLGRRY
jgi:phosphoglycerate dehydrogenase-like enzyme